MVPYPSLIRVLFLNLPHDNTIILLFRVCSGGTVRNYRVQLRPFEA